LSFIIECSVGKYGYNCNQSCDGCLSNSCQTTQGYCLDQSGCKPGWQYVQSVQMKCDIGMLRTCPIIHVKVTKKCMICRNISKSIDTMGIKNNRKRRHNI
jgi:hypothetical protein